MSTDSPIQIGKGATEWQGWDRPESIPGTEEDSNAM
jgi:hypothetical protein